MTEAFTSRAAKLVRYFENRVDESGSDWEGELSMAREWQKLVIADEEPDAEEIRSFLDRLRANRHQGGTAWEEFIYYVSEWAKSVT